MIGSVTIRVSAGRPNMPVGPVAVIQGSACTIGVLDVPRRRFGVEITRVAVSVCNGVGTTSNVPAKFECGVWTSTFDASLFSQPGSVENGVKVFCGGKDENEVEREWTIGVGDVEILPAGEVPVPAPGETWQSVHLRDEEPETPVKGDLFKFEDGWKIFDGEEWQSIGGGAVSSVNGKKGAVVLTGADIKTSKTDTQTISAKLSGKQDALTDDQKAVLDGGPYVPKNGGEFSGDVTLGGTVRLEGSGDSSFHRLFITGSRDNQGLISIRNSRDCEIGTELLMSGGLTSGARIALENGRNGDPATITKGGKEVATEDQLRVTMQLVGNDPYTVQLDGVTQTFAEIKTYAQTRNAVIQRGQGTYRVTYIGANEMMWDVTGTVQGEVKTGQIHIFDQNGVTVVQRVEPKVLATKPMVDAAQDAADGALGFSTYPIKPVVGNALLDRTVNTSTGGAFTFPTSGTGARDFVVVVAASSTAPSVSFPSSGVSYFSDDDAVWTAEADKVNVWYFTEITANQFMVAHKALAATTQA